MQDKNQFNLIPEKKHGYWTDYSDIHSWRGYYINGKRQGIWKCFEYGVVIKTFYYL